MTTYANNKLIPLSVFIAMNEAFTSFIHSFIHSPHSLDKLFTQSIILVTQSGYQYWQYPRINHHHLLQTAESASYKVTINEHVNNGLQTQFEESIQALNHCTTARYQHVYVQL